MQAHTESSGERIVLRRVRGSSEMKQSLAKAQNAKSAAAKASQTATLAAHTAQLLAEGAEKAATGALHSQTLRVFAVHLRSALKVYIEFLRNRMQRELLARIQQRAERNRKERTVGRSGSRAQYYSDA